MPLSVFVGSASTGLGAAVCRELSLEPGTFIGRRFPDGEMQVELQQSVREHDVFVIQSTSPPAGERLIELLLLADACRRAGAGRLTGVIPYLGYARQDRRSGRQSLGARVVADAISTARFDRIVLVDVHTRVIEGFFEAPIDHLSAVPMLAHAVAPSAGDRALVVAPDLGAVKRSRELADILRVPLAVVQKTRISGAQVEASNALGPVAGRVPVIVDDMLSTGSTIEAAVRALLAAGADGPVTVAVTHALFAGPAVEVLKALSLARLVITDSVEITPPGGLPVQVVSLAPLLAAAIRRSHLGESLSELRVTS
jgi:ribose-phosphate pyrophosphokinase